MSGKGKIILICALVSSWVNPTLSNTAQVFKLYSGTGHENFTLNYKDLRKKENLARGGFLCSERGAWVVFSSSDFLNDPRFPLRESIAVSCSQLPSNAKESVEIKRIRAFTPRILSIRHIGHQDLAKPALSLYELPQFGGSELYFDGISLQLPFTTRVQSYGFTGSANWTLFANTDFHGASICLNSAQFKNVVIDGVTANGAAAEIVKIGAIRRGCSGWGATNSGPEHSTLALFPSDFRNWLWLTIDGSELRLPSPRSFNSFAISGKDCWTLFEGTELSGPNHCVHPSNYSSAAKNHDLLSENYMKLHKIYNSNDVKSSSARFDVPIMVGSVRRGCAPVRLQRYQFPTFSGASNLITYNHLLLISLLSFAILGIPRLFLN